MTESVGWFLLGCMCSWVTTQGACCTAWSSAATASSARSVVKEESALCGHSHGALSDCLQGAMHVQISCSLAVMIRWLSV